MFKNTYQSGFLSILYSIGSKPLQIWDKQSKQFFMQFITDISKGSLTRIFNHLSSKLWAPTSPLPSSLVLNSKRKHLESNYPSSS